MSNRHSHFGRYAQQRSSLQRQITTLRAGIMALAIIAFLLGIIVGAATAAL